MDPMSSAPRMTSTIRRWPAWSGRRRCLGRWSATSGPRCRLRRASLRPCSSGHEAALDWSMFPTTADIASGCYNVYETADGQWLALGALESKFWKGFCERIERPDLIPLQHAPEPERTRVVNAVRQVFRTRTRVEWLERFAGDDVCLTTIYEPEEVHRDPHVAAAAGRRLPHRDAPALGADTDAVLEA